MGKKAPAQTVTSEQGIALIAQVVGAMGHLWQPTAGTDSGIDGQIELRDPGTGAVRNVRIGVQSKATTKRWSGETDTSFYFLATPEDIEYWRSSSQPVLLICSRPEKGEVYWRSIQEWAADKTALHQRKITFDKQRDRFDGSVRDQLFNLRALGTEIVQPPGAAAQPERLLTNLMPVRWEAARLYSAAAPGLNPWLFVHAAPTLRDGRVWALRPFSDALVREARLADFKDGPFDAFRTSSETADINLVRELIRRDLLVRHRDRLLWHERREIAYFARGPIDWEPVTYAWSTSGTGRAVVSPQRAKTREGFTGYRHDAAELDIRTLDEQWYVQVKPTYLFTWDGKKVSAHHKDALSKIKRLDKHSTVSQMLRMWQHLLVEKLTLEPQDRQPFELGPLVECSVSRSIIDKTWQELGGADDTVELQSTFDLDF